MNNTIFIFIKKLFIFIIKAGLIFVIIIALVVGSLFAYTMYKDKEYEKYSGHGFDYMHGFSSTDFKGYHVYDGEKLVYLDHESSFIIENEEDMPIIDGAEACCKSNI